MSDAASLGIVIHAPHDLRVEPVAAVPPGPGEVRVAIGAGGICGSDMHYFHAGGFGTVRIREPMVLGHEIAGTAARAKVGPSWRPSWLTSGRVTSWWSPVSAATPATC